MKTSLLSAFRKYNPD